MSDSTRTAARLLRGVSMTVKDIEAQYRETGETYNIFKAAGIGEKETRMCSVLADLLNPKGTHCRGSAYLGLFMEMAVKPFAASAGALSLGKARVTAEHQTDGGRRIDIVIDDGSVFIPIEVKIYAGEQDAQLADYAAFSRKMNAGATFVPVLFLTPDGRESAETPREDYAPIAFDKHIIPWLEKCLELEETKNALPIREMMKQLVQAIKSFCGRIEEESMAINALISESSDSYAAAAAISKAYNELDFDNMAFEIFKEGGEIFRLVKSKVPDAQYLEEEDWWYLLFKIGNGLELSVNYDWKKFAVVASEGKKVSADLTDKVRKTMSRMLDVRNEDDDSVWWSESGKYLGIDTEEDDLYKFELHKVYTQNPQTVADRIVSMVTALKSL